MPVKKNFRSTRAANPRRWVLYAAARVATALLVCCPLLWSTGPAAAQTNGVWNVTTSGSTPGTNLWSTATNWQGSTIASGTGATADFSQQTLTNDLAVHLDTSETVGAIVFGDKGNTYNWTIDGNAAMPITS